MSRSNFIGSGKNSAHPLLDRDESERVQQLWEWSIHAHDECHAMILVSWIEAFIFRRGVIIQMKPMKWCNNIFDK